MIKDRENGIELKYVVAGLQMQNKRDTIYSGPEDPGPGTRGPGDPGPGTRGPGDPGTRGSSVVTGNRNAITSDLC